MTANIHEELYHIVELKRQATRLDNLLQGYRLCARSLLHTSWENQPEVPMYIVDLQTAI